MLVVGASTQWFVRTLAAFAVPPVGASALLADVARLWERLAPVTSRRKRFLRNGWGRLLGAASLCMTDAEVVLDV
jgi:hypothetical protein